jgi:hypothetical protein
MDILRVFCPIYSVCQWNTRTFPIIPIFLVYILLLLIRTQFIQYLNLLVPGHGSGRNGALKKEGPAVKCAVVPVLTVQMQQN